MEGLFLKSKDRAISRIKSWKLNQKQRKQILKRVRAIKLYWMGSLKSSRYRSKPLEFTNWGIAYEPVQNEINMGLKALAYPNEETYLAVFAHEIGHSFDSCRWGAFFEGLWPFKEVGQCLRGSKSVAAKTRDDSKLEAMWSEKKISSDLKLALQLHPTCNKSVYPPVGIQADQLPEVFADWFSAEVVADFGFKNLSQLRSDLCKDKKLADGSSYVSNSDRLNKIYLAHPVIRNQLKEKGEALIPKVTYCKFL